jgi:hypothetical protein
LIFARKQNSRSVSPMASRFLRICFPKNFAGELPVFSSIPQIFSQGLHWPAPAAQMMDTPPDRPAPWKPFHLD